MRKKLSAVIGIGIFVLINIGRMDAAYINTDSGSYDYSWLGATSHLQGYSCLDWVERTEWYKVGVSPYGKSSQIYRNWTTVPCGSGALNEIRYTWHDAALNPPAVSVLYYNGAPVSTNSYSEDDYKPKRLTEMANYIDKTNAPPDTYKYSRTCFGNTRMWVNSVTNGNYHFKIHFEGGYWTSWWPGEFEPGDYTAWSNTSSQFSYVADGVKIAGINCDANGDVTFYWNPYGGVTKDITPTVTNATKKNIGGMISTLMCL